MTVTITYCRPCGYLRRAEKAATALENELGVVAELVPGKGGIYQVAVNGEVVAKKTRSGFPEPQEICAAVAAAAS
ncbi:SelT/SelW/SelH family protein [Nocardia anaemiae]|uniref:SelT/SelW/SelH family protein n=1 Tax=Nocardia anaemiae TaxID=263910 RepID=UPI0007A44ABE|nr:Rdx family protein [Nocardia anaemiae]